MFSSASCLPMAVESAPQESFVLLLPTSRPAFFHTTCSTCLERSAFSREACHLSTPNNVTSLNMACTLKSNLFCMLCEV